MLKFVAIGHAHQAKAHLYGFETARQGAAPSWDGAGGMLSTAPKRMPIADRSWWEGRWALCALTLRAGGRVLSLPDAVVQVQRQRNIVCTQLVGAAGTVKEYINDGDYALTIQVGVVATDEAGAIADEYPVEELIELRQFLDLPEPLECTSEFLRIFDINRLVVRDFGLSQNTASNYQTLTINAISDGDYNVYSTADDV